LDLSILLIATTIGTLAARAWLIASIVCGMTASSAATTRTTMSVALAPRARIDVKASWPGVSRKTIGLPWTSTRYAPMCCVMPPASPAATLVWRIASRSEVLPWSTWPITVTTGARGTLAAPAPSEVSRPERVSSSSSSNETTAASTPTSLAIWTAVEASSVWLTVASTPRCMSSRWMSRARTPSFSESSLSVTPSVKKTGPVGAGFLNSSSLPESWARVSLAARRIADLETGRGSAAASSSDAVFSISGSEMSE
jgi:hypothetical protein